MSTPGGIQAALDVINLQALRHRRDAREAEFSWEPAADGDGLTMTATWPDGFSASGYAPRGMADMQHRPKLTTVH